MESTKRGPRAAAVVGDAVGFELKVLTMESEIADERKRNEVRVMCQCVYVCMCVWKCVSVCVQCHP